MKTSKIWIIESAHINPHDFYIDLDGSPSYKAYWVAQTKSEQEAEQLTQATAAELELGDINIIQTTLYSENTQVELPDVLTRIKDIVSHFEDYEDVQLAAWISSEGGLL